MAKIKAIAAARPPADDDDDDNDCPRCPPVGAPAWMATFADIAVLLMAFFVLILSFANFDEVSFKKMTGALRDHFGTNLIEIMPNPESTTVLEMDFRPATNPPSPQDAPEPDTGAPSAPSTDPTMDALAQALAEALEQAGASATMVDGQLTLSMPDGASTLAQALQQAAPDLDVQQGRPDPDTGAGPDQTAQAAQGDAGSNSARRAAIAEARLSVALRELEDQGLVDVQRDQEKVIVTVGAGGAFRSGSADLTDDARAIMERIALASAGDRGLITVTGHTDTVPLAGGPFVDNWGLAAARAASVVRELGATGMIAPDRLTAVSRGETMPVADNISETGRETNRRIEIEFDFAKSS
jgi:chemotaxis protein MotB